MLAADKLQLKTTLKQQATALKEKEFKLHHENLRTVGTQAAVLAGLDITLLIELTPSLDSEWIISTSESHYLHYLPRFVKGVYYITIVSAFCANIFVVGQTTVLSVMGASLALRGPDGSMMTATDGLYDERNAVFKAFARGLALTLGSVVLAVWLIIPPEAALVCMACTCYTAKIMKHHYERIKSRFIFNEEDTVDFTDLFDGPGNVELGQRQGHQSSHHSNANGSRKKRGVGMGGLGILKQDHNRQPKYSPAPSINLDSSDSEDDDVMIYNHSSSTKRRNRNRFGNKKGGISNDYDYDGSNAMQTV